MFMPTFGFRNPQLMISIQGIKITQKFAVLLISISLHRKKFAPSYTSPDLA
jgi:hypothetical protein